MMQKRCETCKWWEVDKPGLHDTVDNCVFIERNLKTLPAWIDDEMASVRGRMGRLYGGECRTWEERDAYPRRNCTATEDEWLCLNQLVIGQDRTRSLMARCILNLKERIEKTWNEKVTITSEPGSCHLCADFVRTELMESGKGNISNNWICPACHTIITRYNVHGL